MKLDKGLNRDLHPDRQIEGSWRDARNLVVDISTTNLKSEQGFTELTKGVLFENIIGVIKCPDEFIYFVYNPATDNKTILRYKGDTVDVILHTSAFEWSMNSPIGGEYYYNYKNELNIEWHNDIDVPRILNVDDVPFLRTPDNNFVDSADVEKTRLFSSFKLPSYKLTSVDASSGTLKSGVYYITLQYQLPDKSFGNYQSLSNPIFINKFSPKDSWYNIFGNEGGLYTSKSMHIKLSDLDERFPKFRVGIIYKADGVFTAYVGTEYYTSNSAEITISTIDNLTEINVSEILTDTIYFTRISSSTVINNILYVSGVNTEEQIKYQKFANNIQVGWLYNTERALNQYRGSYKDEVILFDGKTFMPDEVYALYIRFVRKSDGSTTEAFHIPGRAGTIDELADMDPSSIDKAIYPSAKKFHLRDTSNASGDSGQMGYWENASETYPISDEYNGYYDYDNNVIPGGGTILNDGVTKVRHHKFPSVFTLLNAGNTIISNDYGEVEPVGFLDMEQPVRGYGSLYNVWSQLSTDTGTFVNDTYYNNTGSSKDIALNYSMKVSYSTNYSEAFTLKIQVGLSTNPSIEPNTFPLEDSTAITTTSNASLELVNNIVVTVPDGQYLVARMWLEPGGNVEESNVEFSGYFSGTFDLDAVGASISGKVLALTISNVYIPNYIKEQCSHFEILYAERDNANTSVLSTGLLSQQFEAADKNSRRFNCFDLQNTKLSLNPTHTKVLYYLNHNVAGNNGVQPATAYNAGLTFPGEVVSELHKIDLAKYVNRDAGYSNPSNENRDAHIHLEYNDISGAPPVVTDIDDGLALVTSICSFKKDVYKSFLNQKLVRTGSMIRITATNDVQEIPKLLGGDIVYNLHGVTTFHNNTTPPSTPENYIDYYLVPVYSVSNIGYRWVNVDDIREYFFPKYNILQSIEGYGGTVSGLLFNNPAAEGTLWYKVTELVVPGENLNIWEWAEYYGYSSDFNSILNVESIAVYNPDIEYINEFIHRVHRSQIQQSESLEQSWRTFLANEYYDSVYNKGRIVALDTDSKDLLIEHEKALMIARELNTLKFNDGVVASLGDSDMFDNQAREIIPEDSGYVGCQCKFAAIRTKYGNVIVDRQQGKIFLYNNGQIEEITRHGLKEWFAANIDYNTTGTSASAYLFDTDTEEDFMLFDDSSVAIYKDEADVLGDYEEADNPFTGVGITVSFDEKYERLVFTKNNRVTISGAVTYDRGYTISYYPLLKQWVSFHDYTPQYTFSNRKGVYNIDNRLTDGKYHIYLKNTRSYPQFGDNDEEDKFGSYIDVVFNTPFNVEKLYTSLSWESIVKSDSNIVEYAKSFDYAVVYNYNKHSDVVSLVRHTFGSGNIRNTGGTWKFNEFRDVLSNKVKEVMKALDISELQFTSMLPADKYTQWYEYNKYNDNFIVVRLGIDDSNYSHIMIYDISANSRVITR